MKILFLDWKCFDRDDTINALKDMGHEVNTFFHEGYNDLKNEEFLSALKGSFDKENPDLVFTYNYYPLLAEGCKEAGIPCISFIYDSPYTYLYSYTLMYPTNHVFLFDRSWVNEFNAGGLTNVHYMALPANANRIKTTNGGKANKQRTKCDVSFVGRLYNEKHNFYERLMEKATPYLGGYLDAVVKIQQQLMGSSIVEEMLSDDILRQMQEALPVQDEGVEPKGYRYANYFIKRKVTQVERMSLLAKIGENFGKKYDVRLFTEDPSVSILGVKNMGVAGNLDEMPYVFRDSRINLNISLRSITAGIPLRCMDIMSCGGFLLSNYQEDLLTDFVPGEEFAFYVSPDDMMGKIEYYLTHEGERADIARAGYEKVSKYFSFEEVFGRIFDVVFPDKD